VTRFEDGSKRLGARSEPEASVVRPGDHAAVVLNLSATGLALARSLGARGVRVLGSDPRRSEPGHFSRWVKHDRRIARRAPGPELLEGLCALGSELAHRPVLYTAGDLSLEFACEHHVRLREHFLLPASLRPEEAGALVDRRTCYERCAELGAALPTMFLPDSEAEAQAAAHLLRYPAIVKPTRGHRFRSRLGGATLVEVDGPEPLLEWWRRFREWGGDAVLQEVVPGPDRNLFVAALYVDGSGTCRALFTARKARQYPPRYGSGCYLEACWSEEIAELSLALVAGLGYRGLCGTEYKWDPRDEHWKLIEINPRPTPWFALPAAAGIDLAWHQHADLTGHPEPVQVGVQRSGARWQQLSRDLLASAHGWRAGELSALEILRTAVDPRGKRDAVLSLRDPGTLVGAVLEPFVTYFAPSAIEPTA
jgi:D-aspartate ligase